MNTETVAVPRVRAINGQRAADIFMAALLFVAGGVAIAFFFPISSEYTHLDRANYSVLMVAYLFFALLVIVAMMRKNLSIFEPLTLVTVLIFSTFVLYPLRDVLFHDMISHGKDVSSGCIKATSIVVASYTSLYIFYYTRKSRWQLQNPDDEGIGYSTISVPRRGTLLMLVVWIVSFAASVSVLLQSGMSVMYLFSLGLRGEYIVSDDRILLLFLANFGISLVTAWIYLLFNAKSRLLKGFLTALTCLYAFARMSRWLILIVLVAPIVYYFSLTRRRVSKRVVIVAAAAFLLVAAWMQVYRYGFRRGITTDLSFTWDLATLMGPFRSDFTTYKAVYGMVEEIPAIHDYFLGKSTVLSFFTMMIPRVLWPGKPLLVPASEIVSVSVNESAREAGMAFYSIGEYYADFGPLGALIMTSIFGYVLGRFLEPKRNSRNANDLLAFSIMYPLLFQWTARGNTGANVWLTIFAMLPVELLRFMGDE